jgi:hypothetical protein
MIMSGISGAVFKTENRSLTSEISKYKVEYLEHRRNETITKVAMKSCVLEK